MLRFRKLEALGLRFAGITEAADGDFSRDGRPAEDALDLAGLARGPAFTVPQVHGTRVWPVGKDGPECSGPAEGDGLITDIESVAIGVRVADCVPVYLYDSAQRAAGVVHAGRQGTHGGVTMAAVHMMQIRFGSRPYDLHALIGPSAGPCCYQVSEPLAADFVAQGLPALGRYLDLWEANAIQLERCGVPRTQIEIARICTICALGRFHSHRATGTRQRNLALISL